MADSMSHNPAQTKDKVRPGAAGATTGADDTITSVTVATRVSNDGGDDSADDLDDSRTDDISEVVDVDGSTSMSVSRLTDLETPSFSEESFSKEDVFFNTTTTALGCAPVIPTSSQYGLAIVANLEGDNPSTSSPVNCINSVSANDVHSQYYSPPQGSIIQPKVVTMQTQNQATGYPTQTSMTVTQTQNVNSTTHLPAMSQGASMPQQSIPQSMAQAQSLQAQSLQAQSLQAQLPPQQHQHQQHPHQQPLQMAGQALSQMQTLGQGQSLPQNLTSSSVPQPAPQQQQIPHQQLAGQSMPQMQTMAPAQSLPQGVPSQNVPQSTPHQQLTNQLPPLQTMAQVQNLPQSISQSSVPQPAPQQGQMGPANALLESLVEATNAVDDVAPGNTDDTESASGTNAVAIDNKIEQAMDLVKSHLMFAVREEVEVLKEKIAELMDRISQLELENSILKAHATQETLAQLNSSSGSNIQPQGQQGSVSQGQSQQTPPQSTQSTQHQNGS
ncbi:hypothetical protein ONE63_007925 [Megalurothrips usitatus]|uniref:TSC22 domain family protein 1-like n=1 Tax=Megalurothrips usitatus TaxID=439358 RepID=A0AAV7XRN6_9NEOP|nr:hypothetical protein ONE63_007925 [Megalurothrips usitatus]